MVLKDWSWGFPESMQLQSQLLCNLCNRQPWSTCNWLWFSSVASLLPVRKLDFKTLDRPSFNRKLSSTSTILMLNSESHSGSLMLRMLQK